MKCSKCGHKARTLAAMAKHYRKKHPGAMKRNANRTPQMRSAGGATKSAVYKFCPHCGGFLG